MYGFLDDSGDGGMKLSGQSSPYLIMAACVFTEPSDVEDAAKLIRALKARLGRSENWEFKYSKTSDSMKDEFFAIVPAMKFSLRAIVIDKAKLDNASAAATARDLKAFAICELIARWPGSLRDMKLVIDGVDKAGFGSAGATYFRKTINNDAPGTIKKVAFEDSRRSVLVQLADMAAGAINRSQGAKSQSAANHLRILKNKATPPIGFLWEYPGKDFDPLT